LTGAGTGTIEEECGQAAHNSFVQAFVETGIIGGTLWCCLICIPLIAIFRLRQPHELELESDEQREIRVLSCFVFGFLAGFATCCYSLTRNSAESTYLFLGLGASYLSIAHDICPKWYKLDLNFIKGCAVVGFVLFFLLKMFTVVMAKY
jgi:O-antigen ligase